MRKIKGMKRNYKKWGVFFALVFVNTAWLGSCSCRGTIDSNILNDVVTRENYQSVYSKIGKSVTLDMVQEKQDGRAYITQNGVEYELGMDFLSMAMVYNAQPCEKFDSAEKAYNEWWRLFMQRWNYLAVEIPLYSNQYYDVYNGKIQSLQTTPFWSVADAIVGAKIDTGENSVIIGSNTHLTGLFRNAAFGKSAGGAADLDVQRLTQGYSTVVTDMGGSFAWAGENILTSHSEEKNADGTKTFTVKIADDLVFSDGSPITAEHYIVSLLAGSTKVMAAAGGGEAEGLTMQGYEAFNAYTGEGEPVPFSGVRLLDQHTFSVTVKEEYADYYYAQNYSAFTPAPLALYLGEYRIKDDGQGAYIEKGFYQKAEKNGVETFVQAENITRNMNETSANVFPYSGPYYVENYDKSTRIATLKRNANYKGDIRGKASIERISYVPIVAETQLDQLKKGRVDVLGGVTGGEETKAVLAIVDGVKFKETHYDRAGYGKLAFRCDFSPTQFEQVRRAMMYTIDRGEFAQTFTGGYGSVVHAPYYIGSATYLAVKDNLKLNSYEYGVDKAIAELEKGGWIYNSKGDAYAGEKDGVRYKKLEGYEKTYNNLAYAAVDGKYKTEKIDGEYYMPLVINWMGTQPNPVTDQLITAWQNNASANGKIGAYITYTSGDMASALYGEYYQMPSYGFTKARFSAVNFATGYTSAVYDQSFRWTIDPATYQNYSSNFLMDQADFWDNYPAQSV